MNSDSRRFMNVGACCSAIAICLFLISTSRAAEPASHPIVAGFERMQAAEKPDPLASGQLLLSELNCASCHQDSTVDRKQAPILDNVASRVHIGWLRKFLHDP